MPGLDWFGDLYAFNMYQHAQEESGHCIGGDFNRLLDLLNH